MYLYNPNTAYECCNILLAWLYSILILIIIGICLFFALMIGGFFINIFICWFGASYYIEENVDCIIPLDNGILYVLGFLGFPLLLCCSACCISIFKGITAPNRIGFSPSYIV